MKRNSGRSVGVALALALLVVWLMPPPVYAIAPSTVLKRIEECWNSLQRYQVNLGQSVYDFAEERERGYAGALFVLRGQSLRLDYQALEAEVPRSATAVSARVDSASFSPEDIYLADSQFFVHYDRKARVVTKQYLEEAALPPIVQALAGTQQLRAEEFQENYYIKPVEEQQVNHQSTYLLRFTPKGQQKESLVHYALWVNEDSYLPVRLQVTSQEEQIEINFYHLQTDTPLPENIFDVRFPDDVQFIDQTLEL